MANLRGELPIDVSIDGRPAAAESAYWWSGGGAVLTISTVLPRPGLALEVISTYAGHPDTETVAVHLVVSAIYQPRLETVRHPSDQLNTLELARQCAYDHCTAVIEACADLDQTAQVHLGDHSFEQLEGVS